MSDKEVRRVADKISHVLAGENSTVSMVALIDRAIAISRMNGNKNPTAHVLAVLAVMNLSEVDDRVYTISALDN